MLEREDLEKKWRGIIKGFESSFSTVESYAREHHISPSSLYRWSKRLCLPLTRKEGLSFVELRPLNQQDLCHEVGHESCQLGGELEIFCVEVTVAKGGHLKVDVPWPRLIDLVKALL